MLSCLRLPAWKRTAAMRHFLKNVLLFLDYVVNCNLSCADPGGQSGTSWVPSPALVATADARQHRSATGLASSKPQGPNEK